MRVVLEGTVVKLGCFGGVEGDLDKVGEWCSLKLELRWRHIAGFGHG